MNFVQLVRLLVRFSPYIMGSAIVLAGVAAYFSLQTKKEYKSQTLLNTGLISGYNIESNKGERIDYAFTNNEMENLINLATSHETHQEVSLKILAQLMLDQASGTVKLHGDNLSEWYKTLEVIPVQIDKNDSPEKVFQLLSEALADRENPVYELINSKNSFVGLEQIEKIKVARQGNSDMIGMEYTSIDPYLSQLTLELLTEIFMAKQKGIKQGQTDSVILFFEEATQKTLDRLQKAEDELLKFRVQNQIINYYEQTRFIAGNREELDKEYQEQLRVKAGAESSLVRMESEIKDKQTLAKLHQQIAENQNQMADYNFALVELDLIERQTPGHTDRQLKAELETKIDFLKTEMVESTAGVLRVNQTSDGVPTSNILTQWLNSVITKEEATAKLKVMEQRQKEYDQIYDRFAPLGSTLKRLESEIDVAEREYLENLHSFNQARLHKYNMLMSSNLKVIDKPNYPAVPEKSKAVMMVVLAFMVGLVVPSGAVIAAEMLDSSLKSPKKAAEQTGLKVSGLMPLLPGEKEKSAIDFPALVKQAMNLFVQELKVSGNKNGNPIRVVVSSIHPGEGKSKLIEEVNRYVAENLKGNQAHFQFVELPALLNNPYSEEEIQSGDVHVLLAKADRKWTEADQHAVKVYKKYVGKKPILFLNKVRTDIMEDITGEVPRKRSWLRAKVKALLS
ncbi:uncharacterized protein involved in exopolysaccharide biosynthesis [Algoriphagus boseongensis]|uniref:Uncharacterized protein involved in exopolysaccharide biosynthesis n=1 Tax=Algoriphagus boseongensis TaxID=1442587 RepID=A0A4V3D254_9BACT|nr:hypothetical protein [Algoriphagus boseongensis]TDQ17060.1 uncharacterized protein involved in exopolysaccharide biosynthesis [Algoriphagus boseongensis]